jgi:hypothetical protein
MSSYALARGVAAILFSPIFPDTCQYINIGDRLQSMAALMSVVAIVIVGMTYTNYVCQKGGHLLHVLKWLALISDVEPRRASYHRLEDVESSVSVRYREENNLAMVLS